MAPTLPDLFARFNPVQTTCTCPYHSISQRLRSTCDNSLLCGVHLELSGQFKKIDYAFYGRVGCVAKENRFASPLSVLSHSSWCEEDESRTVFDFTSSVVAESCVENLFYSFVDRLRLWLRLLLFNVQQVWSRNGRDGDFVCFNRMCPCVYFTAIKTASKDH